MAVGCLITLSPSLMVVHRQPCWPWPAPGTYPQYLPSGVCIMFFPILYTRFRLGDTVTPAELIPYFHKVPKMKVLAKNIPITLASTPYTCDILLGLYANTERAAIILCDSRPDDYPDDRAWVGEPVGVATVNAPFEYLQHLDASFTAFKTWAENANLLEQLLPLTDPNGSPLFLPSPHRITLGFCRAPIIQLGTFPLALLRELRLERKETPHG